MRIVHKRNDTFFYRAELKNEDGTEIDITDFVVKSKARGLFSLSIGNGITVIDPTNGVFELRTETTNAKIGLYQVDVEFTDLSGVVFSSESFEIDIIADVTCN